MIDLKKVGKGHPSEIMYVPVLKQLVLNLHAKVVLEIGSGAFTFSQALLAGLEITQGHLYTCDPNPKITYFHPQMTFIRLTSDQYAKAWKTPINLLMIDGDHSAKQVSADFDHFHPFVTSPGYIVFHDINVPSAPGVKEIWTRLKLSWKVHLEITSWPGLGVLKK